MNPKKEPKKSGLQLGAALGQKIVAIKQSRGHARCLTLDYLELGNGLRLIPFVHETDFEHEVSLVVNDRHYKGRKLKNRCK